ncbi:NAD(P)H-binding protein [Streptomyces sp. NPDC001663]|uniref:NmrA family NAD(P)-binding protein n=1 Tax=Streptomyces sp. NPDC001663 TaxID=3364597 RepID=UPI00367D5D89
MPATDSTILPVLVVGATGSLGSKVVDELLKRGKNVRALVRPASDASRLESRGVQSARGDMLNVDSLVAAMNGAPGPAAASEAVPRAGAVGLKHAGVQPVGVMARAGQQLPGGFVQPGGSSSRGTPRPQPTLSTG